MKIRIMACLFALLKKIKYRDTVNEMRLYLIYVRNVLRVTTESAFYCTHRGTNIHNFGINFGTLWIRVMEWFEFSEMAILLCAKHNRREWCSQLYSRIVLLFHHVRLAIPWQTRPRGTKFPFRICLTISHIRINTICNWLPKYFQSTDI